MKTTSYEISKKLAKAGFDVETDFYWYCYDNGRQMRHIADADGKGNVKAYDLETLIEALPKSITKKGSTLKNDLRIWFDQDRCYIGYQSWEGFLENATIALQNGESLADCAGRLLLKLIEKGSLTFNN